MKTNINIFNALNESLEEEFEAKRKVKSLKEADKVEIDKDGNKSIRDTETGHLKKITVSKKTQDKMADEYNKKLNETGEWDDNDPDMQAWLEDLRGQANELANEVNGEVKSVTGFDAYQGPRAIVNTPKYGDIELWYDQEDDSGLSFNAKVAHVGWISGGINQLADLLNQDEIPENEIINEASFNDKVKAIKKSLRKDKRTTTKSAQKSAEKIAGSIAKNESEDLKEEDIVQINDTNVEPDYLIQDVTVLDQVGDGDVQSPDIEALLTLVDSALKENYSNDWGHIKTLSSKIDENSSYALVDITTPEILKEFEDKGIKDAAIGKNLILEKVDNLIEFKVNNLNGTTKYSKKTTNPQQAIYEWIETEFLQEAKEEKAKEAEVAKAKTEKETVENYINNRIDLKMEIENIKMFIELSKEVKAQDDMKSAIQKRMYAFAAEVPYNIEVKSKNDQYELSFSNLDQVVEMIFGKEWVKEVTPDNEVIGVIKEGNLPNISKFIYDLDKDEGNAWSAEHYTKDGRGNKIVIVSRNGQSNNTAEDIKKAVEEKYPKLKGEITENKKGIWFYLTESQKLTEAYEQFNIGEIEVVFNPDTFETLYSIPSADVQDKKINLTKVPSVETPYDTDTIIKSYIETKFGRIPTEEEKEVQDNGEELEPAPETPEIPQEEEIPQDDMNIEEPDLTEDELPDEPEENEVPAEPEEEAPQAETGSATFMKIRPKQNVSIEDLREQIIDGNTPTSSYIVVDQIDLSAEEFEDLSTNLNEPRSWLEGIQAIDRKNYSFNVIKVTSAGSSYDLLIDPLGYNYPRYISVLDRTSI